MALLLPLSCHSRNDEPSKTQGLNLKQQLFSYFFCLIALLTVPAAIFYEYAAGIVFSSDKIVQAIASSTHIVSTDIALLGELTPAVVAGCIAALSPRPMPKLIGVVSVGICLIGYICYLALSNHADGGIFIFEQSMRDRFAVFIEGNVNSNTLDASLESLESFFAGVRVFYLVAGFSIVGFMLNDAGKKKKDGQSNDKINSP